MLRLPQYSTIDLPENSGQRKRACLLYFGATSLPKPTSMHTKQSVQ